MATGGFGTTTPAGTPAYDVIINLYPELVTSISQSPEDIVDQLLPYQIFSTQDQQYLRRDNVEKIDKARKIVDIVKEKVKSNPQFYEHFRKVIKTQECMVTDFLRKLDDEYKKCTQNKQTERIQTPSDTVMEELTPHEGVYTYVKHGGPQSEYLHESILREKTDTIRQSFAYLVLCVARSMKNNDGVEVEEFIFYLCRIQAIRTEYTKAKKECLLFDKCLREELQNSSNFYTVFDIIEDCYSWINYGLIESIIEYFCEKDQSVKARLNAYKNDFKQYCNDCLRINPKLLTEAQHSVPTSTKKVEVPFKVEKNWDELSSKNIDEYRIRISTILHMKNNYVLLLKTIEEGCVKLTFEIPQHVADALLPLTEEQIQALQKCGIKYCEKSGMHSIARSIYINFSASAHS